jgi:hypothetical protein
MARTTSLPAIRDVTGSRPRWLWPLRFQGWANSPLPAAAQMAPPTRGGGVCAATCDESPRDLKYSL